MILYEPQSEELDTIIINGPVDSEQHKSNNNRNLGILCQL